jgi:hypothetical protein
MRICRDVAFFGNWLFSLSGRFQLPSATGCGFPSPACGIIRICAKCFASLDHFSMLDEFNRG